MSTYMDHLKVASLLGKEIRYDEKMEVWLVKRGVVWTPWLPLENDGTLHRLGVELELGIEHEDFAVTVFRRHKAPCIVVKKNLTMGHTRDELVKSALWTAAIQLAEASQ